MATQERIFGCDDITPQVLEYLDASSLCTMAGVSQELKHRSEHRTLWNRLSRQEFHCDGNKAQFSSNVQTEVKKCQSELESLSEEVSKSLYGVYLVALGAVTAVISPIIILLKLDGLLGWSWTSVLSVYHVFGFTPLLFIAIRVFICQAFCSKSLNEKAAKRLSKWTVYRVGILNSSFVSYLSRFAALFAVTDALPLVVNMYLEGYLRTFVPVACLAIAAAIGAVSFAVTHLQASETRNYACVAMGLAASSLALLTLKLEGALPQMTMVQVLSPFLPIFVVSYYRVYKYFCSVWKNPDVNRTVFQKLALSVTQYEYAAQYPPVTALLLLCMRATGYSSMSFLLISADYWSWLILGPLSEVFGICESSYTSFET